MSASAEDPNTPGAGRELALAHEAWLLMSELVIDHQKRRDVVEATGMSFAKSRALRRLARRPMSMRELADALTMDPPNATVLVADLESQGLVTRTPHPTDGRAKIVTTTARGAELADRAGTILSSPPPALTALSVTDLDELRRILQLIRTEAGRGSNGSAGS